EAMAVGCRARFGTDLAVSTVGLAGPGGGSESQPVGLVFAGLAWAGGVKSQQYNWGGTRAEVQSRTAKMALNLVRLHLLRPAKSCARSSARIPVRQSGNCARSECRPCRARAAPFRALPRRPPA